MPRPAQLAFAEFAAARWESLFRFAYLVTGSSSEAEDCVQAALAKAYVSWSRIEQLDHPDAYVRKILVNTFLSARRRSRLVRAPIAEALEPQEPSPEAATAERLDVLAAIAQLPPRQRAVIVLRFYSDASVQETADALGCSVGTVKSQTSDGLRSLRRHLAPDNDTEGIQI